MISKNELKYFSSLLHKQYRKKENKFIVEGKRLVDEALASTYKCDLLICSTSFYESSPVFISNLKKGIRVTIVEERDFKKVSNTISPQGVAAVLEIPETRSNEPFSETLIVGLENISDPGNLGTIIRTCDWFGLQRVIISSNSAELYDPKVIRSTMGSIFHLDLLVVDDLCSTLVSCKQNGTQILCADINGENVFDYDGTEKSILVLSNEAHGPTKELLNISDRKISIPKIGNAESLNVASAGAILIAQLTGSRSRTTTKGLQ